MLGWNLRRKSRDQNSLAVRLYLLVFWAIFLAYILVAVADLGLFAAKTPGIITQPRDFHRRKLMQIESPP